MTDISSKPLPDFDRPPVIEVVCGIQFAELANLHAARLGTFWQQVREEYPVVEEHPPLAEVNERFEVLPGGGSPIEIVKVPPLPRLFLVHRTPNWLIQIQRNRFLHNWRTVNESDEYPRFPAVFDRFWIAWTKFFEFARVENVGDLKVNQLELTYINHIPSGTGWSSFEDIRGVLPDISWRPKHEFLPPPEFINWQTAFVLPQQAGRLHVSLKHGIRKKDSRPVLLCELTARGMSRSPAFDDVRAWFQLGREWIVRGFADLTGPEAQKVWGRRA